VTRGIVFVEVDDLLLDLLIFPIVHLYNVLGDGAIAFVRAFVLRFKALKTFFLLLGLVRFKHLPNCVFANCLWVQSLDGSLLSVLIRMLCLHLKILIRSVIVRLFLIRLPWP
jgi:hypothetical protein